MTPHQVAKAHCCNYQDGVCIGMDFNAAGKPSTFRAKGRCWLSEPVRRCQFFEETVIPMSRSDWPGLKTAKEHEDFDDGVRLYRRAVMIPDSRERVCPVCGVRPLEPYKRLCYVCREAQAKASMRERNARRLNEQGPDYTES